jgi:hypothetical protein
MDFKDDPWGICYCPDIRCTEAGNYTVVDMRNYHRSPVVQQWVEAVVRREELGIFNRSMLYLDLD